MVLNIDLLEVMSMQADCMYLSDLTHMNSRQKTRLARWLRRLPADAATLMEWNEALNYIVRSPPQDTPQAVRERLLCALSAACDYTKEEVQP